MAINRSRVTHEGFEEMLKRFPPGTDVELAIFRRGLLRTVPVGLGTPPPEKYVFTPLTAPEELARKVYEGWIGAPWEPAAKSAAPPS